MRRQSRTIILECTRRPTTFLEKPPSTFSLCRYPSLRKNVLIAGTLIFVSNYCYYGSIFGLEALKGSIYFNSIFSAGADLIGYTFVAWTLENVRRKVVFMTTLSMIVAISVVVGFNFIAVPYACTLEGTQCW
jgi:hypothetical protein